MKDIKIKLVGFWSGYDWNTFLNDSLGKAMSNHFNLIESDDPDYVLCSVFGPPYEFLQYECVRILYNGETLVPDFSVFDYAISYQDITFHDRYFRYGGYNAYPHGLLLRTQYQSVDRNTLCNKEFFCNFIYNASHPHTQRTALFHALSAYKRVESAGPLLNNMPNEYVATGYDRKMDLVRKSKFTIAVDSMSYPDFITEKITHAFAGNSIPIYLGSPDVSKIFNEKAFINGNKYNSLKEIVQEVIRLDNDDTAYLEMLRQPPLNDPDLFHKNFLALEGFFQNIFSQPKEQALRRTQYHQIIAYEKRLKFLYDIRWLFSVRTFIKNKIACILRRIRKVDINE